MIPCHSAALRCTWPFAVTCMTPSSYRERDCSPHGGCFLFSPFSSSEGRTPCDDRLRGNGCIHALLCSARLPSLLGSAPYAGGQERPAGAAREPSGRHADHVPTARGTGRGRR